MTTKQEFYLFAMGKQLSKKDVIAFCSLHRSVQWRVVGKNHVQVKFGDRGNFQDPDQFCDNFRNGVIKDLNDRVASALGILTKEELAEGLSSIINHFNNGEAKLTKEIEECQQKLRNTYILYKKAMQEVESISASLNVEKRRTEVLQRKLDMIKQSKDKFGYKSKDIESIINM